MKLEVELVASALPKTAICSFPDRLGHVNMKATRAFPENSPSHHTLDHPEEEH